MMNEMTAFLSVNSSIHNNKFNVAYSALLFSEFVLQLLTFTITDDSGDFV